MPHRWIFCWALTPLLALPALAQSVISAHSGVIHFADGSVFLDDQRVEQKSGKFDQIKNGSELRTGEGRAEVLLTPGTFLRMGANSGIRMISNQLEDTRVELLNGSAVLDQGSDTLANTSVTVLYNLDQVHIKKPGRYRFDSEPPQVKVETGDAEVTAADGKSVEAGAGYAVALEGKLTARKLLGDSNDGLDSWSSARDHSVADSNLQAAASSDLSNTIDGWQNDPDAVLQSLGIPPYPPGMSSYIPPYGYGSGLYGAGLYGSGLYGAGFGYGPYGYGAMGPLALYYWSPLYVPYRYPYGLGYRGAILPPGRIGTGRPVYQRPSVLRMGTVGVGVGVGHAGAVHAGGHR